MFGGNKKHLTFGHLINVFDFESSNGVSSTLFVLARICLCSIILVSTLYLLQRYAAFPFSSGGRLVLIALTLTLAILAEWRGLVRMPIALPLLGLSVAWAGLHTYLIFGFELSIAATSRFVNVMVIAPLGALLFVSRISLKVVFLIYLGVFLGAYASLLYQYLGGSLPTLVQNYLAIRADLVRHMTIVGEPNVGGMLAVLGYVIGITILRKFATSVAVVALATVFVIMTLSKGAALGICLASLALFLLSPADRRVDLVVRGVLGGFLGVIFVVLIGADAYLIAAVNSVFGQIKGEPSAMADFAHRQVGFLPDMDWIGSPISSLLTMFFGSSFGVAGSAAYELLGGKSDVVLPHNSYLEMMMVGGVVMLGSVIYLMAGAFRRLISEARSDASAEVRCAIVCLMMLSCWMLIYPVIYEPVTGTLLWSLIGYGHRISKLSF